MIGLSLACGFHSIWVPLGFSMTLSTLPLPATPSHLGTSIKHSLVRLTAALRKVYAISCHTSGKENPLRGSPPLRTVRETFTSYGSSMLRVIDSFRMEFRRDPLVTQQMHPEGRTRLYQPILSISVLLSNPSNTDPLIGIAPQHELLKGANFTNVALCRSPKDPLS
jgi:hypothetical protein